MYLWGSSKHQFSPLEIVKKGFLRMYICNHLYLESIIFIVYPFPSPGSARFVSHLPHWRLRALWRQWQQLSRRKRRLRQIDQLLGSVVTGCLRQMLWAWQKVILRKARRAEAGLSTTIGLLWSLPKPLIIVTSLPPHLLMDG